MTGQMLRGFANDGYLDQSFATNAFDPYYEPYSNDYYNDWSRDEDRFNDSWDMQDDYSIRESW